MKRFFMLVFVLSVLFIAASMPVVVVSASPALAPAAQEAQALPTLLDLLTTLKSLGGVAVFFAALINAGKYFGWLKDGSAPTASLLLNAGALVALAGLQVAGYSNYIPVIDETAGLLATVMTSVLALVYQLWVSRVAHVNVLAGMPVIGKSNTNRAAGEGIIAELKAVG